MPHGLDEGTDPPTPASETGGLVERLRAAINTACDFVPWGPELDTICATLRQAAARIAELERERDEALCLAEGPSTLIDLARGAVERGFRIAELEADAERWVRDHGFQIEGYNVAQNQVIPVNGPGAIAAPSPARAAMRKVLEKAQGFVDHTTNCAINGPPGECTCGFDAMYAAINAALALDSKETP